MGSPQATVSQMVTCYMSTGHEYPSSVYSAKGASAIGDFCDLVYKEAVAEGVRPEVLFSQAMFETGWLQFGGSVDASQCNFGGIGAISSSASGASFSDVAMGLRAQAQHLKAYASMLPLNQPCVDPRFNMVIRGCAPTLEDLNGKWAVPGKDYGQRISAIVSKTVASRM